jgi:hypothetical protein
MYWILLGFRVPVPVPVPVSPVPPVPVFLVFQNQRTTRSRFLK